MSEMRNGESVDDRDAVAALITDLHWQIDQMGPRGIKDAAGKPYNPSYYKRGLQLAIERGDLAVPEYIRRYLSKPPSEGYKKLEEANSLDLACETLIADASKPYSYLFSDAERTKARERLAPHLAAIERRKAEREHRIAIATDSLPHDLSKLRELAAEAKDPEDSIAINSAIVAQDGRDVVALNRLARGHEALGTKHLAVEIFREVIRLDPANAIATRHLRYLDP